MNWSKIISPFILAPVIAGLAGNFSLGFIIAGLTGLIWGTGSGSLFISLTTTLLLILTGNINMEIIFLYTLSLAYLVQEEYILGFIDKKLTYIFLAFLSLLFTPLWSLVLGLIPAGLLNELNIAGELLVIAGLLLFAIRIRFLVKANYSRKALFESLLVFICSVVGLMGSILTIPLWIGGTYLLTKLPVLKMGYKINLLNKHNGFSFLLIIIFLLTTFAIKILLPLGFFSGALLLSAFFLLFRKTKQLPTVEIVYLSMILGIVASRMGLLL